MALSPQYGWSEPDNSSLVKNGAADIRTLGDAIDTSVWNVGFGQAGKNKIINGDFGIWQRGTSFSNPNSATYSADRWRGYSDAASTVSRQTFTPGTAPVAGYESSYFIRIDKSSGGNYLGLAQKIEDVRTFAGQTVTVSFWAKANVSNLTLAAGYNQDFGSGGSGNVAAFNITPTLTTSWARYSYTIAIPSIAGKTIGTGSSLDIDVGRALTNSAVIVDFWGVQVEYGSKATPFQTATGTLAGELDACEYYYQKFDTVASAIIVTGQAISGTAASSSLFFRRQMRTSPTVVLTTSGKGAGEASFLTASGTFAGTVGAIAAGSISKYGFDISGTGYGAATFVAGNASLYYGNGAQTIYTASAEL